MSVVRKAFAVVVTPGVPMNGKAGKLLRAPSKNAPRPKPVPVPPAAMKGATPIVRRN